MEIIQSFTEMSGIVSFDADLSELTFTILFTVEGFDRLMLGGVLLGLKQVVR